MRKTELWEYIQQSENYNRFENYLETESDPSKSIHFSGIKNSAMAVFFSTYFSRRKIHALFVASSESDAGYLMNDIKNLTGYKSIFIFPSSFKRPLQYNQLNNSLVLQRTEVINNLSIGTEPLIIITYPDAVFEKTTGENDLHKNTFILKINEQIDIDFFIEYLTEHGFRRTDFVYEAGDFSIRGGIIDIFSYANNFPYRIELNANQIESLREFDPLSQLSVCKLNSIAIIPDMYNQNLSYDTVSYSLIDYLSPECVIFFHDATYLEEYSEKILVKAKGQKVIVEKEEEIIEREASEFFLSSENLFLKIGHRKIVEYGMRKKYDSLVDIKFRQSPQPSFNKNFELIRQDLNQKKLNGYHNLVFSDSGKQIERLFSIFDDLDPGVQFEPVYHAISEGFVDDDLKLVCYTEHQLFNRFYRYKSNENHSRNKVITLKELRELKSGDYVVHHDHGIGKFAGLEKINMAGGVVEAVRLVYRDNDLLYVSINSLYKISKFIGKDGTPPKLNKIGSDSWDKLKRQTKSKVKDIARDLIQLYAARKSQSGFSFSPDSYLQTELEASFQYEDTPDQSRATEEMKRDMESSIPMDRLVCGDVGFGKTEIAIRSAFKACCDSKQVAVLVPTTILASQHYRTFKERLKQFPVNVDFINRFRTQTEQKEILRRIKEGKIDILIGTHRLLSKDVVFKNLGLMIIDEEQKFGVTAKEKLKQMRVNVDTLTLTATPIPRTLHFSLMGARDLSIINTPPPNRQPVNTELHAISDELIKEAVENELARNGQVFIIHNRVKDIYVLADKIRELVPGATVGVGHGQLEGHELENVMIKFVEGEYDVLVATTIIESGLDISNANTIIINNAHMYGLSDIHQMRGRVGRSNIKAYCYLLVPGMAMLTPEAKKRLSAIEEFSDLGSGFNIAMKDLDIRGSGNLLGAEQSGFIAEIGFDMYHKILDEAIQELKEQEFSHVFPERDKTTTIKKDLIIDTDVLLVIPDSYVRNNSERLTLYTELSTIDDENQLMQFSEKLLDRFGKLPEEVLNLLEGVRLKWIAQQVGFEKLIFKKGEVLAYFPSDQQSKYYESHTFSLVLDFIGKGLKGYKIEQTSKHLMLHIASMNTIHEIIEALNKIIIETAGNITTSSQNPV